MEETPPAQQMGSETRRRRWKWLATGLVLVLLTAEAAVCVLRVGQWLVVQDALEPAHAVVVLSGRMPERAREAAQLYHQGNAARIWITRPAGPEEELQQLGVSYVGEEFYNEKVLLQLGVPSDAIRVLEPPIFNTEDEVLRIAAALRQEEGSKVIVVTSQPHTRRVRAIWKRRVGDSPKLIVRYTPYEAYDGAHWWRNTQDALDVVREVLGLANAWAGFPLRPATR